MTLTLKNYETVLPKELMKLAEKNQVRECDETEKGHFIAYIDEGNESFDVSLTILFNEEEAIAIHTCDCKNRNFFCRHKVALLMHIAKGKKTKNSLQAKKKESRAEMLLEEAELTNLKEWLKGLLQKNKDIELSFTHYFSGKQQQYTPDEVVKLTNDAIRVVAGNKKSLDATQLKKLTELWAEMHSPIVQKYQATADDEKSFLNFHAVVESCSVFQSKMNSSSNRIPKYIENLLQQSVECINNLHTEDAWDRAVSYFVHRVFEGKNKISMHYLLHLKNVVSTSNEERRKKLIELLATQYGTAVLKDIINDTHYSKLILEIVENHGLFSRYYNLFKPIQFDNEFNQKLIHLLIETNHLKLAGKYCQEQILDNYRDEYNPPYLKFLKEIYTIQKDNENLAIVLTKLLPYTFDFDDYLFTANRREEEERKKWRTKILSRARTASHHYNKEATEFCFKLLEHEKSYRKMIDYIDSYTPYNIILRYFEPMALTDKARLLKAIFDKRDDYGWGLRYEYAEKDATCFPGLFDIAIKHYSADYLEKAISKAGKDTWHFRLNRFLVYMNERLTTVIR